MKDASSKSIGTTPARRQRTISWCCGAISRCYVMFRRDRRKNFPLFASILHVSNPELFEKTARHVYSYLLTHFGIVATLAEKRVVAIPIRDFPSRFVRRDRRCSEAADLRPDQVDYLYSELTCVPW